MRLVLFLTNHIHVFVTLVLKKKTCCKVITILYCMYLLKGSLVLHGHAHKQSTKTHFVNMNYF